MSSSKGSSGAATQEATGQVQSDSLAAESVRSGGGFSSNRDTDREQPSGEQLAESTHKAHAGRDEPKDPSSGLRREDVQSYGGEAPSYVSNASARLQQGGAGEGRPHGKGLTEGGFEGEGPGDSINAAVGSIDDPGRVAERNFGILKEDEVEGVEGEGGRAKGTRAEDEGGQTGGGDDGQNVYEELGSDNTA